MATGREMVNVANSTNVACTFVMHCVNICCPFGVRYIALYLVALYLVTHVPV